MGLQRKTSLEARLNGFVQSLGDVLVDITALEVNTMIVEEIAGDKFLPWEVYRDIFPICQKYCQQKVIAPSLHHRYLELRKKMELQYILLVTNPDSELFEQEQTIDGEYNQSILTDASLEITEHNTYLPNPLHPKSNRELVKVQKLLNCNPFLRTLRKIGEIKTTLDHRNFLLTHQAHSNGQRNASPCLNTIYAQTIVQLDGDVVNRFNHELLNHPQRELLIQIHQESIQAGQQQWKGLLGFMIEIVQGLKRTGKKLIEIAK